MDGLHTSSYFQVLLSLYQFFDGCAKSTNYNCTVTFMFHSFFYPLVRSRYLSFSSFSFNFILWSAKQQIRDSASSLLYTMSGRQAEIRWSVYISKSQSSLCVSFSRTDSGLYIYHLFVCSNFNFLHNSHWITLPTQWCLVLYSFCTNWLHSLNMWLIVSSLSLHNQRLLFCCVLSILALIWFVLMALFWAAYLQKFSFSLKVSFF